MLTLEQERAAFALNRIESVLKDEKKEKARYKTQLLKLPACLHSNGLGQTVAFYLAVGPGKPETEICGWLDQWLSEKIPGLKDKKLLACITGTGISEADAERIYREASTEARALAVWLKRFAEAFIAGDTE